MLQLTISDEYLQTDLVQRPQQQWVIFFVITLFLLGQSFGNFIILKAIRSVMKKIE